LFSAMIRIQSRPAPAEARRVPGGKPVAIVLATLGLASTAATIILSTIPGGEETNKPLAVIKVICGTAVLMGAGVAVFLFSRFKARREATALLHARPDRS